MERTLAFTAGSSSWSCKDLYPSLYFGNKYVSGKFYEWIVSSNITAPYAFLYRIILFQMTNVKSQRGLTCEKQQNFSVVYWKRLG